MMSRFPLVRLGIVGLGCDWHESLVPAIDRMTARLRVVAVYDDRAVGARSAANDLQADAVLGIRPLLTRRDLDAVLLGSVGWQGEWLLDRLREGMIPLLIGRDVALTSQQRDRFLCCSVEEGVVVIPELQLRYLPATLRLRELMATTLGSLQQLNVDCQLVGALSNKPVVLSEVIDWATTLIERAPVSVEPETSGATHPAGHAVNIVFERGGSSNSSTPARVRLNFDRQAAGRDGPSLPLAELQCQRGTAFISGASEISWASCEGPPTREKLASDRSSTQVLLDLFARRVLGGLIPTPDLSDLHRASHVADLVQHARTTGEIARV